MSKLLTLKKDEYVTERRQKYLQTINARGMN